MNNLKNIGCDITVSVRFGLRIFACFTFVVLGLSFNVYAKELVLDFNYSDLTYEVGYDEYEQIQLCVNTQPNMYSVSKTDPGLPFLLVNQKISNGYSVTGLSWKIASQKKIGNGILAYAPLEYSSVIEDIKPTAAEYANGRYPDIPISIIEDYYDSQEHFISLKICPFKYDVPSGELYLVDYRVSFELTPVHDSHIVVSDGCQVTSADVCNSVSAEIQPLDYLIITSESLKDIFLPLIDWKRTKGLRSDVVTIESIQKKYTGDWLPLKIKQCLKDYQSSGLQYVLLGGDDSIIPVVGCYGYVKLVNGVAEDYSIPADIFYACFEGCFDWDENCNGVRGELEDGCVFTPEVTISRLPVRSTTDVIAVVNKIINYERRPKSNGWNNSMLTCGVQLDVDFKNYIPSDAEMKGDIFYNAIFNDFWNGSRVKFYDSCPIYNPDGTEKILDCDNLLQEFNKGYAFVQMITHGEQRYWQLAKGYFMNYHAELLSTKHPCIITTVACNTNAFDISNGMDGSTYHPYDPSLSEAFIRNGSSGVIGYLGNSRLGFYTPGYTASLGKSLQFELEFYRNILYPWQREKNFGKLVDAVKKAFRASYKEYGAYRWLLFGVNAIGDPEMQVYGTTPLDVKSVKMEISGHSMRLDVGTEIPDGGVGQYNKTDNIVTYKDLNNGQALLNVSNSGSICVSRIGYVPLCVSASPDYLHIGDGYYTGTHYYSAPKIEIGSDEYGEKVLFDKGEFEFEGGDIILGPGVEISSGTKVKISTK